MPHAEPSTLDQIFRYWDKGWKTRPWGLVKGVQVVVDVQNVAAYSEMMTYEKKQIPRIGRCFSPWNTCLLFWSEPTTNAGMARKAAIVAQVRGPDESAQISGLVIQQESRGMPLTILSGGWTVDIPAGGIPEEMEDGRQAFRLAIFGDRELDSPVFEYHRRVASEIASPTHMRALHYMESQSESFREETQKTMQIVLCAFSFANCRNVQVVDNGFTSPPPKWQKEQNVPRVRHSVVKISAAPTTRTKGPHGESGIHMGLHICRGHFKTFTAEKPLLGKHVGTYWWPQTTRGNAEHGVIDKSYKVETGGG